MVIVMPGVVCMCVSVCVCVCVCVHACVYVYLVGKYDVVRSALTHILVIFSLQHHLTMEQYRCVYGTS